MSRCGAIPKLDDLFDSSDQISDLGEGIHVELRI